MSTTGYALSSAKRLRVLFGVRDDLQEYAEAIAARLGELALAPALSVEDFGAFTGAAVHRAGSFQAELIELPALGHLPVHAHPRVESIDLLVSGNIAAFRIGEERISRFVRGMGLRIAAGTPHGGSAAAHGLTFVSCQRWAGAAPSHIGLDWRGARSSERHARLLAALGQIK